MGRKIGVSFIAALLSMAVISTVSVTFATEIPAEVGKIDAAKFPSQYKGQEAVVSAAIVEEYKAQLEMGFNPGKPDSELLHEWSDGSRGHEMSQNFQGGDSNSLSWGKNKITVIMVEKPGEKAYTIKNDMVTAYANFGSIITVGPPRGNEFKDGNDTYQNFKWGYIKLTDGKYFKAKFYEGKQYQPTGQSSTSSASAAISSKETTATSSKPDTASQTSNKVSSSSSAMISDVGTPDQSESSSPENTENATINNDDNSQTNSEIAEPVVKVEETKPLLVWIYVVIVIAVVLLAAGGVAIYLVNKKSR